MTNDNTHKSGKLVPSFEERLMRTIAKLRTSYDNVKSLVTFETLNENGDVGTGANQLAAGNHTHDFILGDQNLDGGSASSVYTANELFDGGSA
jgi:hypothetical protein